MERKRLQVKLAIPTTEGDLEGRWVQFSICGTLQTHQDMWELQTWQLQWPSTVQITIGATRSQGVLTCGWGVTPAGGIIKPISKSKSVVEPI